jgi:hypothetical protein
MATQTAQPIPSGNPGAAAAAVFRAHTAERETRRGALDRRVEATLLIADELENNCRAALGMELNAAIAAQGTLEHAAATLRGQVVALGKRCAAFGAQYDGLARAVAEAGPVEPFLEGCEASLARINHSFAAIERLIENS